MNSNQVSPSLDGMCLLQAAQALQGLAAGQAPAPDACAAIFGPAAASYARITVWFWQQDCDSNQESNYWELTINPASEVLNSLLVQLAHNQLRPIVPGSFTQLQYAVLALDEALNHVELNLVREQDDGSTIAIIPNYWVYAQDLQCAKALLTAAHAFLVTIYGDNPPLVPYSNSAFGLVLGYLSQYRLTDPDLCAYVLLALADLQRDDDWRRGTNPLKQKSEIVAFMQQNFALIPNRSNDQLRDTALTELINAGIIDRPYDTTASSNLANCAYRINAQVLAQLQQAANAYSAG